MKDRTIDEWFGNIRIKPSVEPTVEMMIKRVAKDQVTISIDGRLLNEWAPKITILIGDTITVFLPKVDLIKSDHEK